MKHFYVGLDIGTNSVGIACADENYNLLRAKGKDCWAVRLFDEGKTAVDRRVYRTARRRLERRKYRIKVLQELFAPYISDETFFLRLNNSQYYVSDKDEALNGSKYCLFDESEINDKDYYKKYPTIYHLRAALQTEPIKDIRLYYLAVHHIVKYRGHFLFDGSMEDIRDINRLFSELNEVCEMTYSENIPNFNTAKSTEAKDCCLDANKNIREKITTVMRIFGLTDSISKEIITGICGGTVSPKKLFNNSYKEEPSFSFKKLTDEMFEGMAAVYNDDFALISVMRSIYNFITFEKILNGQDSISAAMIALYEKHNSDLKLLKRYIKNNATQEEYNRFFKSTKEGNNYANYIGYTKKGGKKKNVTHCKTYEDFLGYTKKFLIGLGEPNDVETYNKIMSEIENATFLPKILNADNGLFPHQINEYELNKIIENMIKNIPETEEIKDKVLSVFLFKIPYYVGPLAKSAKVDGKNSWAIRKEGMEKVKITPWNFDEVIDKAASNEEFMRRMTNKCSYLSGEDVLPKCSIYYQKFNVLNTINKLRINDAIISVEVKQAIYNELFLRNNKVRDKDIKSLLLKKGYITENQKDDITISGKDGELVATMSSYIQLKKILGDFVDKDIAERGGVCENIILWHTLNTDKQIVVDLIKRNYSNIPQVMSKIKELKGLSFKDFGRLSKTFLVDLPIIDKSTGEQLSLLDILYKENQNLNEILFNERYNLNELVQENNTYSSEITYSDIEALRVPTAVKRGIYQAIKCVDEYVSAIGREPDKIFVEVTREDDVKGDLGRKESRKRRLLELYKGVEGYNDIIQKVNEETDMRLRQERLYLYYRQLGKCMYSGECIDLEQLNTNMYDVDHIIPRSFIKDDSLDNKVLVLRSINAKKSDNYPVPQELVTERAKRHWLLLRSLHLISENTYNRLSRVEPLNDDDYNDFINRQKTITDQTAKAVIDLLRVKYKDTRLVFSKAKNVSDFKKDYGLYKCRETNDLHHARDAYLNIVVGNVYDTCFSTPMSYFKKDGDKWRTYNLETLFKRNIKNAWVNDNKESLLLVKRIYSKTTMCVTRYAYCNKGEFYKQTIFPKTDTAITAPRKSGNQLADASKYGGYKTQKTAYFAIVESEDKKGKIIKTIEAIPVMVAYQSQNDQNAVEKYFNTYLKNVKILVPKLKNKQLIKYNNTPCYIAGVTGGQIGVHIAIEFYTDNKTDEYVNQLLKLVNMVGNELADENAETYIMKTNREGEIKLAITKERNIALYNTIIERLRLPMYQGISSIITYRNNIENGKEAFVNLSTYKQSKLLLQIFKFLKCNAETSDLTIINGGKSNGRMYINKDITDVDFRILSYSPCGLTVREKKV